jgi:hypothetical protein
MRVRRSGNENILVDVDFLVLSERDIRTLSTALSAEASLASDQLDCLRRIFVYCNVAQLGDDKAP